jgi:hypothetical protein
LVLAAAGVPLLRVKVGKYDVAELAGRIRGAI